MAANPTKDHNVVRLTPFIARIGPFGGKTLDRWKIEHDGVQGLGTTPELAFQAFLEADRILSQGPRPEFALDAPGASTFKTKAA